LLQYYSILTGAMMPDRTRGLKTMILVTNSLKWSGV